VKWCGDHWLTTSQGTRPAEPERPSFLVEAAGEKAIVESASGNGRLSQQ
jgi:hypothetical protein